MSSYTESGYNEANYMDGDEDIILPIVKGVEEISLVADSIIKRKIDLSELINSIKISYLNWDSTGNYDRDIEYIITDSDGNIIIDSGDDEAYIDESTLNLSYVNGSWELEFLETQNETAEIANISRGDFTGSLFIEISKYGVHNGDYEDGDSDDFVAQIDTEFNYDFSNSNKKKINFIVDNENLDENNMNKLLLETFGSNYADSINIIFGEELKIGQSDKQDIFSISKLIGGVKEQEVIDIVSANYSIPDATSIINTIKADNEFISLISQNVLASINVNVVAKNGEIVTSNLVFDEPNNKYILDYDTSLLDGTDYIIELSLD